MTTVQRNRTFMGEHSVASAMAIVRCGIRKREKIIRNFIPTPICFSEFLFCHPFGISDISESLNCNNSEKNKYVSNKLHNTLCIEMVYIFLLDQLTRFEHIK